MGELLRKRGATGALLAVGIGAALLGHETLSDDTSKDQSRTKDAIVSIYDMQNAAANQIKAGEATGDSAVVVVGPKQGSIGEIVEDIAAEGSGVQMTEQIKNQNNDSTVIQEGQRFLVPINELDPTKTDLTNAELPVHVGYGPDGTLVGSGPTEEAQVVTLHKGSPSQG